ncbi:hypothetical protein DRE_00158 [Drechslerella stenobrocha 248]|uniref:Uncharacterized protein n=1 Tax=Drechslerella stenobrocha 248 TaxID=1043628 RepID=W7I954_9PEZI|nr:hypothetical protein DRE_00158 [Drechslerella stenobrocha 248]
MKVTGLSAVLALLHVLAVAAAASIPWKDSQSRWRAEFVHRKYRQRTLDRFPNARAAGDPSKNPYYIELPLDHFGTGAETTNQTFKNRYYVQDAWYKPGGPVIFQDIGESSIQGYVGYMTREHLLPVTVAKRFNGLLIMWEHRFYGRSAPITNVSTNILGATPQELTDLYKYLTIEQALEDVTVFARNFSYAFKDLPADAPAPPALTPDVTPWIFIGVSYSGNRGAWMAKRNPGLFKATLASSAPVQQQVNFWQYFTAIEDSLDITNRNCSLDLHAAATWMSEAWEERNTTLVDPLLAAVYKSKWTQLLDQFPVDSEALWDYRVDFLTNIAWTPFEDFQYVGIPYGVLGITCNVMETAYNPLGNPAGVFATEPLDRAVQAYTKAIVAVGQPPSALNNSGSLDPNLDGHSWFWQVCSEVGVLQVANVTRPQNLLPAFVNVTASIESCVSTFGLSDHVTRAGPDIRPVAEKYEGWNVELPNVLWVNGEFDPWRALSLDSADAPRDHLPTTVIPKCGESFAPGVQLRYVIKDAHHGSDLAEPVRAVPAVDEATTAESGSTTATKTVEATSVQQAVRSAPVVDAIHAQNLWLSAVASWVSCTTLPFPPATTPTATPSTVPYGYAGGMRYPIARAKLTLATPVAGSG